MYINLTFELLHRHHAEKAQDRTMLAALTVNDAPWESYVECLRKTTINCSLALHSVYRH